MSNCNRTEISPHIHLYKVTPQYDPNVPAPGVILTFEFVKQGFDALGAEAFLKHATPATRSRYEYLSAQAQAPGFKALALYHVLSRKDALVPGPGLERVSVVG